jgi:(1->4)-alpha-D-glucan 1-alpha-D-glucosylmutase
VNRLTAQFLEVCEDHRCYRDYTRHEIHHAIREVIACFPVYRTYVEAEKGRRSHEDAHYVSEAIAAAMAHRPDLSPDLFDFIGQVLLLETRGDKESEFVMRFQQFTGSAMAKGVEDTTFYVFNRLVSLNEVGGDPSCFGISVDRFHQLSAESFEHWPESLITTSTHDTKRSEDVRARINLLSEIHVTWIDAVRRWASHNEKHKTGQWPDRNMEYLFYQTIFGAWPISQERIANYMEKSSREAKTHTSWTEKHAEYDEALMAFVKAAFEDEKFLQDVEGFTKPLIWPGRVNSLAQALLRLTAPGIPDQYQGTEIWDLSLVDPDNRRPVDFELRRKLLCEMQKLSAASIVERADEGLPKLLVTRNALLLRRERPHAFGREGTYISLAARGEARDHVVAFGRGGEVITVVPRLVIKLNGNWGNTTLNIPECRWRNVFTNERLDGGVVRVGDILNSFPVALLARE